MYTRLYKGVSLKYTMKWGCFSPPARWGLLDFITVVPPSPRPPRPPPSPPRRLLSPPPPLPPLPRPLPPCQLFANLFANFRAQWALLDLNCRLPIWVGTAGPQPQGSEHSGHRWRSTRDLPSPVGTAGPQPGTFRAQWAPQRPDGMPEYMPHRMPHRMPKYARKNAT